MSPFYAYAIGIAVPWTGLPYQSGSSNYVISFTSREVADEWWRTITNIAQSDANYRGITRVTPRMYLYDTSKQNISTTISNGYKAQEFYNCVFFNLLSGPLSIIPQIDITDHISGKSYFIRSKINPATYWWVDPQTQIVTAATTNRTKFRISFADEEGSTSNNVMINSDSIKIILAFEACSCGDNAAAFVRADGTLSIERNGTTFKFGDFARGFEIKEVTTGSVGDDRKAIVKTGDGEAWELE